MTLLGLGTMVTLGVLGMLVAYWAGVANAPRERELADPGETDLSAKAVELFGRAREYNRLHPEPVMREDLCGYEYATIAPCEPYLCSWCGRRGIGVRDYTRKVEVSYADETAPLGRRQTRLGIACGPTCAQQMFDSWVLAHEA